MNSLPNGLVVKRHCMNYAGSLLTIYNRLSMEKMCFESQVVNLEGHVCTLVCPLFISAGISHGY